MMTVKHIAAASVAVALSVFQLSAQVNADARFVGGQDYYRQGQGQRLYL